MVKRQRHILKAITWRIVATTTTFLLAWFITGEIEIAIKFGVIEVIIKLLAYYLHERMWYKWSKFGLEK